MSPTPRRRFPFFFSAELARNTERNQPTPATSMTPVVFPAFFCWIANPQQHLCDTSCNPAFEDGAFWDGPNLCRGEYFPKLKAKIISFDWDHRHSHSNGKTYSSRLSSLSCTQVDPTRRKQQIKNWFISQVWYIISKNQNSRNFHFCSQILFFFGYFLLILRSCLYTTDTNIGSNTGA